MNNILKILSGDKGIWAIISLLALVSFMPVYSSSSNLVYLIGKETTFYYLMKHAVLMFIGFVVIIAVHKVPYNYFSGMSLIVLPVVVVLLIVTLSQGTTIAGANASRWLRVPFVEVSFQTSSIASVVLPVYVARYLARTACRRVSFKESFLHLWGPVFLVCGLILLANLSTALILFGTILILCIVSNYSNLNIFKAIGVSLLGLMFFVLLVVAFPKLLPNRVDTWVSRVESYFGNQENINTSYQVLKAKTAIANGGILGVGAGKSVMKNMLPHSSSDFIYAIVLEEYGALGGVFLITIYFALMVRLLIIINKTERTFGKLLVCGVGFPILFYAFTNMAVAVNIIPVTGQNLPLITSGGTSIWMTCLSVGIVLSVSAKNMVSKNESTEENNLSNPIDILSAQV